MQLSKIQKKAEKNTCFSVLRQKAINTGVAANIITAANNAEFIEVQVFRSVQTIASAGA